MKRWKLYIYLFKLPFFFICLWLGMWFRVCWFFQVESHMKSFIYFLHMTVLLQSKPLHEIATAKNPVTQCSSAVSTLISVCAALKSPVLYSALESVWLAFSAKRRHFLWQWLGIWTVFQRVTWESVPSVRCSCAHILDVLVCYREFPPNFFFFGPMSSTNVLVVRWWIHLL